MVARVLSYLRDLVSPPRPVEDERERSFEVLADRLAGLRDLAEVQRDHEER